MNGIFIRLKSLWLALAAIVAATGAWAQGWDAMPQERAARLFTEAQRVCDADGGRLWGENIWGEVVLVRDADKLAFCNDARLLNGAREVGELYCGTLDSNLVVAGNAARLRGVDVAIVPMFEMSDSALVEVFVHELFHRFQNRHYGSDEMVYDNAHVDTKAGRTLVLCELAELAKALEGDGTERREHVEKALGFRAWRRTLFVGKDRDECRFELQEGLALYTQYRLCLRDSAKVAQQLGQDVGRLMTAPNLSRQYGYYMGAMYACLNDVDATWRNEVTPTMDLGERVRRIYGVGMTGTVDTLALKRTDSYAEVMRVVDTLEAARMALKEMVRRKMETNNVVWLQAEDYQMGFNPACVTGLEEMGNFFSVIELKGEFGRIYSEYGCVISGHPMLIIPEGTKSMRKKTKDFAIELSGGWRLRRCDKGYDVVRKGL